MKVLVVERVKQARRALVEALAPIDDIAVYGALGDLRSAERVFAEAPPDVVVTGTELEDARGLDLITSAARLPRSPRIVVVADAPTRELWRAHLDAGATCVVERDPELGELVEVVTTLARHVRTPEADERAQLVGRVAAAAIHDLDHHLTLLRTAVAEAQASPHDPERWRRAHATLDAAAELTRALLGFAHGQPPPSTPLELATLAALLGRRPRPST